MRLAMFLAFLGFAACAAAPKSSYIFKTAGNCAIRADVYRPPGPQVRPAILWIHGGALISGGRANIRARQLQRYLDEGFAVVSIDYRLAPETKLPEILEDVGDAYRWLRSEGPKLAGIDPDRIAVVGHSAGGYLTLTCGYRLNPRPRALVSFYGYGDITGDWYSKPDPFYSSKEPRVSEQDARAAVGREPLSEVTGDAPRFRFYLYCRQNGLWPKEVAGRDPRADPKAFDPWSPVRNVTPRFPPAMLLHGDKDTDVPFEQSELMAREFRRHGVEHELVRIPGGEHGFDGRPDDPAVAQAVDRAIAFLKKHLK